MVNPQGMAPSKMPLVKNQKIAIHCMSDYGPTFGGGHDLHISNNANTSGSSYSNLGNSYHLYIKCVPVLLQTTFTVQLDLNSFNLTEQRKTVADMNR